MLNHLRDQATCVYLRLLALDLLGNIDRRPQVAPRSTACDHLRNQRPALLIDGVGRVRAIGLDKRHIRTPRAVQVVPDRIDPLDMRRVEGEAHIDAIGFRQSVSVSRQMIHDSLCEDSAGVLIVRDIERDTHGFEFIKETEVRPVGTLLIDFQLDEKGRRGRHYAMGMELSGQ